MRSYRENKIQKFFSEIFKNDRAEHAPDYVIVVIVWILVLFGLIVLLSASPVLSYKRFGSTYHVFWHQFLFGVVPGLIGFYIFSRINFNLIKKFAFLMLVVSIVLLILVFIPGLGTDMGKDAKSWINVFGFSLQPSEVVKLTFLIYLASWLESMGHRVKDLNEGFLPFLFLLGIISALVLLQPDLGTLSIIFIIAFCGYFAGGGNIKHMLALFVSVAILFFIAIKMSSYRAARLLVFLHPNTDTKGIGYHLNQALIAIGSGGIIGVGLGQSRQKYGYVPEVSGDSIFAVMAEETGFVICLIYLFLLFLLIYHGFKVSKNIKSTYGKVLSAGIISWLGFQSLLNISSMIGLSPMTGVPLPFISYGGTAMVMNLVAVGILVNISKYTTQYRR